MSSTDIYYPQFFDGKEKKEIYSKYLLTIYESLRAYDYDIIGHIGYIMRKAPYKNKKLEYSDHSDVLDEILKSIISKNKTIELNTHSEGTGLNFFPTSEILKRYKELGGTNVSFGSDAHSKFDIGRNYKFAAEGAKEYGFDYWTCYTERRENKIKID